MNACKLLLIDNYDSFAHNLAQRFGEQGAAVTVVRNDRIDVAAIAVFKPDAIVLSPGPGNPGRRKDFGVCADVLRELVGRVPILGVCLGHQGIGLRFGAELTRAPSIVHGKASALQHSKHGLFAGLPQGVEVMRYHSLVIDEATLPAEMVVTARTEDGLLMAIAHRDQPVWGVQFHPESIGTPQGPALIANFLRLARSATGSQAD